MTFAVIDRIHRILAIASLAPLVPPFVSDFYLDLQYLSEVFDDVASLLAVSLRPTAGKAKRCQSFSDRPHLLQIGAVLEVETLSLTFPASPVIWIAILLTDALPHVLP